MDFHGLYFSGSPDAKLFNPSNKIIESGYDSAWPLYALALNFLHKDKVDAASKLTRCAFNLIKTWKEGSPLALYLSIMRATQKVKIAKETLIGIAQAHAPSPFLALHLQLIPEFAEFVDIQVSLNALRNKDEAALIKVSEILRDHPHLSLVQREEISFGRKKSSPRLFPLHTVKEEAEALFHYTRLLFFQSLTALKSSSKPKSLSPLSDLSNRLSYFASLYVLQGDDKTERTRRYSALIQLIDASIKMKNYHAAMSLHLGLMRSELTRLTEFLPDETHEALFSPHNRWETMRRIKGPHIPYSALFSAELEVYGEAKEEALQGCIQSISKRFDQLFEKNFPYSTELPLVGETIGERSQEELERELYRLSSCYKPYPAIRTYSADSSG